MEVEPAMTPPPIWGDADRPVRRPAVLSSRYFLDRLAVAIGALLLAFGIALVLFRRSTVAIHMQIDFVLNNSQWGQHPDRVNGCRETLNILFPAIPHDPAHHQYVQLVRSYVTWAPVGGTLACCALLAIALEYEGAKR